jgi:uncharacterized coiled-coil DUF342 family protein
MSAAQLSRQLQTLDDLRAKAEHYHRELFDASEHI